MYNVDALKCISAVCVRVNAFLFIIAYTQAINPKNVRSVTTARRAYYYCSIIILLLFLLLLFDVQNITRTIRLL